MAPREFFKGLSKGDHTISSLSVRRQQISNSQKSPPQYQYQALPPGPYIRILHLLPGQAADPISCSLRTGSLYSVARQYDALSYEWGSSPETKVIEVDGCVLHVRLKLSAFLKLIRKRNTIVKLWIDAICIDQSSANEKNHQVQQMWSIFNNASTTRVFLDTDVNCPELWDWRHSDLISITLSVSAQAMMKILNARYWTRLWIVQEIIASENIIIHISAYKSLPWKEFSDRCLKVVGIFNDSDCGLPQQAMLNLKLRGLITLDLHRWVSSGEQSLRSSWQGLIRDYGEKRCLDARDHIFALNAMAISPVAIDYTRHPLNLFADVMKAETDHLRPGNSFAEDLWQVLGLQDLPVTDPQLYSNHFLRMGVQSSFPHEARTVHNLKGECRKTTMNDSLFTLAISESPNISLVTSDIIRHRGKRNRRLRRPRPCTGIALTQQQEQDMTQTTIQNLAASMKGAQFIFETVHERSLLLRSRTTLRLSALAYHHIRTVSNFQQID